MLIQITGSSGTVNWCGETWNLPADSGEWKEVCPSFYRKGHQSFGWDSTGKKGETWNIGGFNGDLALTRYLNISSSGFYYFNWRHRICLENTNTDKHEWWASADRFPTPTPSYTFPVISELGLITTAPPRENWYGNQYLTDNFFGSHTIGSVTYTWAKGTNW